MKRVVLLLMLLSFLSCNSSRQENDQNPEVATKSEDPCPEEWNLNGPTDESRSVEERIVNDTIVQQILFDKVWFEIIGAKAHDGVTRAYLKFYRTDGTLESEGFGVYSDHPVADYEPQGEWKYYDCEGKLTKTMNYSGE